MTRLGTISRQRGVSNRATARSLQPRALLPLLQPRGPSPTSRLENAKNPITTGILAVARLETRDPHTQRRGGGPPTASATAAATPGGRPSRSTAGTGRAGATV